MVSKRQSGRPIAPQAVPSPGHSPPLRAGRTYWEPGGRWWRRCRKGSGGQVRRHVADPARHVGARHHLAPPDQFKLGVRLRTGDAQGHTPAGTAAVQPENQAWGLRGPTSDGREGITPGASPGSDRPRARHGGKPGSRSGSHSGQRDIPRRQAVRRGLPEGTHAARRRSGSADGPRSGRSSHARSHPGGFPGSSDGTASARRILPFQSPID